MTVTLGFFCCLTFNMLSQIRKEVMKLVNIEARVNKMFNTAKPVKAVCSVTFGNQYAVHGVKVIETNKGRFMTMPYESYINSEDDLIRKDIFHPVSTEARAAMEEAVFEAYDRAKASMEESTINCDIEG